MGKTAQIQIKGIQRNTPKGSGTDGACQELINLRPRDGAWRPVGEKSSIDDTTHKYTKYIHRISDSKVAHWFVDGTDIGFVLYVNGSVVTTDTAFDTTSLSGAAKFSSLGNVVIMMETNSEEMRSYIFENDSDDYRLVGDLLPELLDCEISRGNHGYTSYFDVEIVGVSNPEFWGSEIYTRLADHNTDGLYINDAYFRIAYELFDGSLVKHSSPVRIRGGFVEDISEYSTDVFRTRFYFYNAEFKVLDSQLSTIKTKYKGIIKSLNIYMSRPRQELDIATSTTGVTPGRVVSVENLQTRIDKVDNFYLVKKFSLEELDTSLHNITIDPNVVDLKSVTTLSTLSIDDLTNHSIYSDNPFVYNQRIIFSTIKNTLGKGNYPSLCFQDYGGTLPYKLYFEVTIPTPEGDKIVRSDVSEDYLAQVSIGDREIYCYAYPDQRASLLRVVVLESGSYYYKVDIPLTPHKIFNFAYAEDISWDMSNGTALRTIVNTYSDENRIQASELYNPFYFPAINSYRIANASIVGLGTNAEAISTSQFGAYPIYAFTNDGIWTLEIGQQGVFIQSIKPLSRHVCNNVASIVSITGGVLFSTDKGLFVIAGSQILEIGQFAEGAYVSPLADLGSYWATKYKGINEVSGQQHWLTREKAITYDGKTYIAYYDDAVEEYMVSTFTHSTKVITNHTTGIGNAGSVHQASMFIDSSGYLYVIANQGNLFKYKKSTNPGDAAAWGGATTVSPGQPSGMQVYNPYFAYVPSEGEFFLLGMSLYSDGGNNHCEWWKLTTYNSGANWHTQRLTIINLIEGELAQVDPYLADDDVLHLGISFFDSGNYTQLQYIKTSAPGVLTGAFTNYDDEAESLPISGTSSRIFTRPTGIYEILFTGITIDANDNVHFAAILTGPSSDPNFIHLHYKNDEWVYNTIFQSADIPATHDGPYFDSVSDGMIIAFEEALRVSTIVIQDNGSGNYFAVLEWVSENNGESWTLLHKYIPEGNNNYTCVAYPKNMDSGCNLVVMKGDDDYTSNHDVVFFANDLICKTGFLNYLASAVMGYDPINNEILVSNSTYDYSWVFDLDNKMWFKISQVWDAFVINFPGLNGYRTISSVYYRFDMVDENESDPVSVHIETRPIDFAGKGYKKIERSMIESYLDPDIPEYLGILLYGSVDNGVTYRLVAAGNITEVRNQFLIGRSKYSCQFFILVIGGKVEFESTVNEVTFDVKGKFQSKLR